MPTRHAVSQMLEPPSFGSKALAEEARSNNCRVQCLFARHKAAADVIFARCLQATAHEVERSLAVSVSVLVFKITLLASVSQLKKHTAHTVLPFR